MKSLIKLLIIIQVSIGLIIPTSYLATDTLAPKSSFVDKLFASPSDLFKQQEPIFQEIGDQKLFPKWIQNYLEQIPVVGQMNLWQRGRLLRNIAQDIFEHPLSEKRVEEAKKFVQRYKINKKPKKIIIIQTNVQPLDEIGLRTLADLFSQVLDINNSRREFSKKCFSVYFSAAMPWGLFDLVSNFIIKEPPKLSDFPWMSYSKLMELHAKTMINSFPEFAFPDNELLEKQKSRHERKGPSADQTAESLQNHTLSTVKIAEDNRLVELMEQQWFSDGGRVWEAFPISDPIPINVAL